MEIILSGPKTLRDMGIKRRLRQSRWGAVCDLKLMLTKVQLKKSQMDTHF